jgi:selenocysteine-specific elongation factor
MPVIATAGHVDHGKTSLLRHLTGMEPSRLALEKKRGMTMQLGFVWADYAGEKIGFVDVPGHTDYTKAMLSGICNVDGFVFVIACDDGFMPQTEEHLYILKNLNISNGLVVLTKTDLVSRERVKELRDEAEISFGLAFDKKITVSEFSAVAGEGDDLVSCDFKNLIESLPPSVNQDKPKILVDRSFVSKGQGTVITGTLTLGDLKVGQSIEVVSTGKKTLVRGIHQYGAKAQKAFSTSRVALNLPDLSLADVPKGTHLGVGADIWRTDKIDIFMNLKNLNWKIKKPTRVSLVHAGKSTQGRIISMGDGYFRLQLDSKEWIRFGERLLVMSSGGDKIIGGGIVLDENPLLALKKSKEYLELYMDFDLYDYVSISLLRNGTISLHDFSKRTSFSQQQLSVLIEESGESAVFGDALVSLEKFDIWCEKIIKNIGDWHLRYPEKTGISTGKLLQSMKLPENIFLNLVKYLKAKIDFNGTKLTSPKISQSGSDLKISGYTPRVIETDVFFEKLEEISAADSVEGHSITDLGIKDKKDRSKLRRYIEDGKIVRLGEKHIISELAFKKIRTSIIGYLKEKNNATTGELRDHLGLGRKFSILLLEQLDHERITFQSEDQSRALL